MTDKDPKDMTAAELLRKAAMRETDEWGNITPHVKLFSALSGDDAAATDYVERGDLLRQLADKIDAELAQARDLSLRQGAELWAKANGWPDFRDGEDFGAWLDRCALMRPRYDNGDPVDMEDFGDPESDDFAWYTVSDSGDWTIYAPAISPDPIEGDISERVERPDPEVMGADGLPIVVGETVWLEKDGRKGIVKGIGVNGSSIAYVEWEDGRWSPDVLCDHLTHTPPDTLEHLRDDMAKRYEENAVMCLGSFIDRLDAIIEQKGGE